MDPVCRTTASVCDAQNKSNVVSHVVGIGSPLYVLPGIVEFQKLALEGRGEKNE